MQLIYYTQSEDLFFYLSALLVGVVISLIIIGVKKWKNWEEEKKRNSREFSMSIEKIHEYIAPPPYTGKTIDDVVNNLKEEYTIIPFQVNYN